jgi:hypothetical protein
MAVSKEQRDHAWLKDLFTDESPTEDVITLVKNILSVERTLGFDVLGVCQNALNASGGLRKRLDVKDGLAIVEFLRTEVESTDDGPEILRKFLDKHGHILRLHGFQTEYLQRLNESDALKGMTFREVMHVCGAYERRRGGEILPLKDLSKAVQLMPSLMRGEVVAAADMIQEMAALCITSPSKAEIRLHISEGDLEDIRISIDTASLINNLRIALRAQGPDVLRAMAGRTFNIEVSSKLAKSLYEKMI